MPGSTSPQGQPDRFAALTPLAQWQLLESGFSELASPRLIRFVPALFIAAIPAVTFKPWGLAWLLAVAIGLAAGHPVAAAFDRRPANAERAPWLRRYRQVLAWQAACLGAGGFLTALLGALPACLLAATAIAFAVTEAGFDPFPSTATRQRMAILAAPLAAGAVLHAALLHGGPVFLAIAAAMIVWAAANALLAHATASRFEAITAALNKPPAAVLNGAVAESPGEQDFQKLLGRDQITGLPNRHSFMRLLALESERAALASSPLTLLVVDWIGHDEYAENHPESLVDSALTDLANCLRTTLRRRLDVLASLGKGKFALLLPSTDAFGGETVAKAVLAAVSPDEADEQPEDSQTAVKIGCATYRGKGSLAATDLLSFAEDALQNARKSMDRSIRHYDPIGKATRPPPFVGDRPKEDTRFLDAAQPLLLRSPPIVPKAIFPRKPMLVIENAADTQAQQEDMLQDQENP
jgi:diguanylate cyclase (GGDEF)-like protein